MLVSLNKATRQISLCQVTRRYPGVSPATEDHKADSVMPGHKTISARPSGHWSHSPKAIIRDYEVGFARLNYRMIAPYKTFEIFKVTRWVFKGEC